MPESTEEEVFGDIGHPGVDQHDGVPNVNREGKRIPFRINARRSSLRKPPEAEQEKAREAEHARSSVRSNAEHVFTILKAGDFCFLSCCAGNIGGTVEEQINGAFDNMEARLSTVGLTLENVVQMDCLFRDVRNISVMEKVIKERFRGRYPARKSVQNNFAHVGGPDGLQFRADAVACCG